MELHLKNFSVETGNGQKGKRDQENFAKKGYAKL